jgi:hypothetical protein
MIMSDKIGGDVAGTQVEYKLETTQMSSETSRIKGYPLARMSQVYYDEAIGFSIDLIIRAELWT